jgi:hypothetical protein
MKEKIGKTYMGIWYEVYKNYNGNFKVTIRPTQTPTEYFDVPFNEDPIKEAENFIARQIRKGKMYR